MKKLWILCYGMICILCLWAAVERPVEQITKPAGYYCMLKEHDGKIGIYGTDDLLLDVIDYPFAFLNDYDRAAMEEGIPVESKEELSRRIEDFTS